MARTITPPTLTAHQVETALANQPIAPFTAPSKPGQVSPWVKQVTMQLHPRPARYGQRPYDTIQTQFYREMTIRLPTTQKTRRGTPKPQNRRVDVVAVIKPNYHQYVLHTCGIEIKVDEYDLARDKKMIDYPPYFNTFYLAVPRHLQQNAWQKLAIKKLTGVGLLIVEEEGQVNLVKLGAVQAVPLQQNLAVWMELHHIHFKRRQQPNG